MRKKTKLFYSTLCSCVFMANFAIAAPKTFKNIPQGKLPETISPISYKIDMTIIPEKETFSGHTQINAKLKSPSKYIYMHGRDLSFSSAKAIVSGKEYIGKVSIVDATGVIRLDFNSVLPRGEIKLVFDYTASFTEDAAGLHRVKVGDDYYAWTQFESIDARDAFPSFDEPGFKIPFDISIATKKGFMTISNSPETKTQEEGDLVRHYFETTKPLPTYLVAFAVGPFVSASSIVPPTPQRSKPLPIRVIATKPNKDKLDYVLAETPRIVTLLEDYFNEPFPYPKLDQIGSPIMPGAMENAGADIYNDSIILLDKNAPTSQKQDFGMIVSHELSHQWFGDYVTPKWWDDIWLNESFANWMGFKIGNEWRPELNIGVGAIDEAFSAMKIDSLKAGRPIHEKIKYNKDIDQAFDEITYGKGGQVVSMIASYMGDEKFRDGVRLHMKRHPHGNASTNEFFATLGDAAGDKHILKSLKSFVDQQGVPIIDIKRKNNEFIATQSRYSLYGTKLKAQKWEIPFCVRQNENKNCIMLGDKAQKLNLKNDVFVPNADGLGYYRYNLEEADWRNLINVSNDIKPGEALAMLDSLWANFQAGRNNFGDLLLAAQKLADNKNSNVALNSAYRLSGLSQKGFINNSSKGEYQKFIRNTYGPKLNKIGSEISLGKYSNDDPDLQKLRAQLIALVADDGDDKELRNNLKKGALEFLSGNENALDPSIANIAMSILGQEGGLETTKTLFEKMKNSNDTVQRGYYLSGLVSGGKENTKFLIDNFNDEKLRASDKLAILNGLMNNLDTRDFTYEWYKVNFNKLSSSIGIFSASSLTQMPANFCSVAKADELEKLLRQKVIAAGRGELGFDRMIENVKSCGKLKELQQEKVNAGLIKASY
ncbi:MAG: M1 family metallopeptidase [Caulobacterales bacterium]|nr:M1 family metallopeptidase [Caulobacterales bacterium]MCA0373938.1 M1 family metallopeptidase [Pseudomonadota bacterium]